eukprot:COSAG01_NODE_1122_length_11627_cov_25.881725_12_plen_105_part_00
MSLSVVGGGGLSCRRCGWSSTPSLRSCEHSRSGRFIEAACSPFHPRLSVRGLDDPGAPIKNKTAAALGRDSIDRQVLQLQIEAAALEAEAGWNVSGALSSFMDG